MIEAADMFPREVFGFTPLPSSPSTKVEVEKPGPKSSCDVRLRIRGSTEKTISFMASSSGYKWVSECEVFIGPNTYPAGAQEQRETIRLVYEIRRIEGQQPNELSITYSGSDPRLQRAKKIALGDIRDLLGEWSAANVPPPKPQAIRLGAGESMKGW